MDGSLRTRSSESFQAFVLYHGSHQALQGHSGAFTNDVLNITAQVAQHLPARARKSSSNKRYSTSDSSPDLPAIGVVPAKGVVPKLSNPLSVIKRPPSALFAGSAGRPDSWRNFS